MATPRDIRRLAFQALYQLDARSGGVAGGPTKPVEMSPQESESVLAGLLDDPEDPHSAAAKFTPAEIRKAFLIATSAFAGRTGADAFMTEAAPTWPAHRQAAVDRAILRLAHHEMMTPDGVHPKIVVNEAVELAKAYSTEKSPAFINGLLDKLLKQVLRERGEEVESDDGAEAPPAAPETIS